MAQRAAEAAQRVRHDAEATAAEKRAQADQAVADAAAYRARAQDALAEAEQKLTAAAEEAAIMRQEAERDKATAHTDGFTQGFRQGQGKFNESVADLLTRDGGEKRITVELIRALSGGSQDRIDQARTQVMSKLRRQAEATLTIGTPVRPSSQRIEAETRRSADAPVTDPEQVRRLMAASPSTGHGLSHGLGKGESEGDGTPVRWVGGGSAAVWRGGNTRIPATGAAFGGLLRGRGHISDHISDAEVVHFLN